MCEHFETKNEKSSTGGLLNWEAPPYLYLSKHPPHHDSPIRWPHYKVRGCAHRATTSHKITVVLDSRPVVCGGAHSALMCIAPSITQHQHQRRINERVMAQERGMAQERAMAQERSMAQDSSQVSQ